MATATGTSVVLPPGVQLAPGERLLWASRSSGTYGYSQLLLMALGCGGLFVLGPLLAGPVVLVLGILTLGGTWDGDWALLGTALPTFGSSLALVVILLVAWGLPRTRLSHFLTTQRLLTRGLFGGVTEARVAAVRNVERVVVTYRSRYGVQEVVTDRLAFDVGGRQFVLGPSRDIDRVQDLVENGVLTRWVELDKLPSLDGTPAPAELAEDFFLCATTKTGGDTYGPLFVGPRVVVRITEELPYHVLGRLYTLLGGSVDGEAAELGLLDVLRLSITGHFMELPRAGTAIVLDGTRARLTSEAGQSLELTLSESASQRLKKYAARPIPPTVEAFSPTARLSGRVAPKSTPPPTAPATGSAPAPGMEAAPSAPGPAATRARSADLEDPTLSESAARTLALAALSATQRRELTQALASDHRVLFGPARFLAENRALAGVAALAPLATVAAMATRLGMPCSPSQDWVWVLVYAAGLVLPTFVLLRYVVHAVRAGSLPFATGLYVLPRDVVVARSSNLRIVPLTQVAAVGAGAKLPLSSHTELTLWIEGEPAESCFVPSAQIDELVSQVERARDRANSAEVVHDPLRELKKSDLLDKAPRTRARGESLRLGLLATGLAFVIGAGLYVVRNTLSDGAALASAGTDVEALACYADNGGREAERVRAELIPHAAYVTAHEAGSVTALTEFIDAYPASPDVETARHEREELAWSTATRDVWSLTAFVAGYPDSSHLAEARRLLPGLALTNAREQDDVASFNNVIDSYPGTPEAEEATRLRHERYAASLATLTSRGGERSMLAFFDRLFQHLEAHGAPEVRVRFRSPSAESLTALDELLSRRNGENVEPIAPSFSARASRYRETIVYDRLRAGFGAVAPADVLPLAHGARLPERLTEPEIAERVALQVDMGATPEWLESFAAELHENNDPPTELPEIRIDYEIVPTGDLFVLETVTLLGDPTYDAEPPRRFAGFRVDFTVEMRIGADPERQVLRFTVAPPETLPVGPAGEERSASAIYELLATAAFDRLGDELSRAFFGG